MDLKSILGYQEGSPYADNPYLDINSGTIDMSNTPIDLVGIDNLGNQKTMKAGTKQFYKFPGSRVREIPVQIPRTKRKPFSLNVSIPDQKLSASYTSNAGVGVGLDLSRNYVGAHANIPFQVGGTVVNAGKQGGPSPSKAAEMLKDGTAHGHKLTKEQKHYFQALAHGWHPSKQIGGLAAQAGAGVGTLFPKSPNSGRMSRKQVVEESMLPTENSPYLNQLKGAYSEAYKKFTAASQPYQYTPADYNDSIGLTQGKYNTGKLPKTMVNRAFQAAKMEESDPNKALQLGYQLLGLAGQESTFRGYGTGDNGNVDERSVISGWTLAQGPQDFGMYLANNSVPGVRSIKGKMGYSAQIDDPSAVEGYLSKHQDLINTYKQNLSKANYSNYGNYFDLAAQRIKKQGVGSYNPGDPTYAAKVEESTALLQRDPSLKNYISSTKFQRGGMKDLYDYLFEEDSYEDKDNPDNDNTAPTEEAVNNYMQSAQPEQDDDALAMSLLQPNEGGGWNPYSQQMGNTPAYTPHTTAPAKKMTAGPASYAPGEAARYALDFYQKKGLPKHVAAGIVGNLIQESGNFRPDVITDDITGDKGTSHGIAQWHIGKGNDRWNPFLNWAQSNEMNPKDLNTQLEYVYQEAQQRGDLQKTLKTSTPEEAANTFARYYERPAIIDKNRARNAKKLYSYQKGGTYHIPYEELVELKKAGYKFKLL